MVGIGSVSVGAVLLQRLKCERPANRESKELRPSSRKRLYVSLSQPLGQTDDTLARERSYKDRKHSVSCQ